MIDFLLDNFPLVIVILGGLLSLLGGDKKKTEKQAPRPRPVKRELEKTPPFGSGGDPFAGEKNPFEDWIKEMEDTFNPTKKEEHRPNRTPEPAKTMTSNDTVQAFSEEENIEDVKEQVDDQLARAERILQKKLQASQNQLEQDLERFEKISSQSKAENSVIKVPKVNRKNVTQGIIWSEILGPPRAKKTYRPNVYQK